MAGRCHSATQVAMGGTRVMRPMCATGQAAGTAAAIAIKHQTLPRGVYEKHIKELQDTLIRDGCRLMKKGGGMREPEGVSEGTELKGIVIDDAKAQFTGTWDLQDRQGSHVNCIEQRHRRPRDRRRGAACCGCRGLNGPERVKHS